MPGKRKASGLGFGSLNSRGFHPMGAIGCAKGFVGFAAVFAD